MAKSLILRFTEVTTKDGGKAWDSNRVIINGAAGVHIETGEPGCSLIMFRSMTGVNMVTCHQDYFGEVYDDFIPYPGIGYSMIFRLNKKPTSALILGSDNNAIDDAGDTFDEQNYLINALAGKEGTYFLGSDGQYFAGKTSV